MNQPAEVKEMWWKDGNEDVLPVEGVKEGGDGMDAGSQPAQPLARHDDSSFEERAAFTIQLCFTLF